MNHKKSRIASFSLLLSAMAADQTSALAEEPSSGEIQEIVVTAQKREERLQDVGLTISAFSGNTLTDNRIYDVADLARIVPGLDVTPSPLGPPVFTLRGVGFFDGTVASYPDVATYLDQAPLSLPAFSALTAFDLERVEVLKGPQGTLFGNSATGGAINFVPNKPTPDFQAAGELGYGRFNTVETEAFVSGPLLSTLEGRVAVRAVRGDDWQYSYTRNDTVGKTDTGAVRAQLDWRPTAALGFLFDVNGWQNRSDPEAPQLARESTSADLQAPVGTVGSTGTITPSFYILHYPLPPQNDRAADWAPSVRPAQDSNFFQTTLTTTYALSGDVTLTSLTSYVAYHTRKNDAQSGLDMEALEFVDDVADASDLNQEVRIANAGKGDAFRWIVGGNFDRTNVSETANQLFPYASTGYEQGFSASTVYSDQHDRTIAGFGNAAYDLNEQFTLKGGARYTTDRHADIAGSTSLADYQEPFGGAGITNVINFLDANLYDPLFCPGVTFIPVKPGNSVSINPSTCQAGTYYDVLREHNTAWSAGLDYKPVTDVLLYVNASKGFKAGAFPLTAAASQKQYYPVKEESLLDYEGGFKTTLLAGRAHIDGAVFHYDYTNKQLRSKVVDPFFGALDNLVNIPKSEVKGAELDITVRPISGLNIRVAATYLDTHILAYNGIVGSTRVDGLLSPVYANFEGVALPFAPSVQGVASADYQTPIRGSLVAFVGATESSRTKSYGTPQLYAADLADVKIPGYSTLDLRAGFGSSDEKWKVMFWGSNVLDRYYWTNSLRNFDTFVRYTGRPAEFGVTLRVRL
jgi:iron complex outermembrane receptor protein